MITTFRVYESKRLAIFLPNWVGDLVMATPALQAIEKWAAAKNIELIGIVRQPLQELLEGSTWLHQCWSYDKRATNGPASESNLRVRLRREAIDTALLLTNSFRTAWLAYRGGIRRRIGYAGDVRRWLLTDPVRRARWRRQRLPRSAVDDYLDLARVLGAHPKRVQLALALTRREEKLAANVWQTFGWRDEPVIAFHPGAAHGAAKCWPVAHFAELARRLIEQTSSLRVLVLCGPGEQQVASEICDLANHPQIKSLAGFDLSLGLTKACLASSEVLVTGDSGPRHIAAAFGVSTYSLFGPTDPCWANNYHPDDHWLQLEMACRPCAERQCPLSHHQCMLNLSPEFVCREILQREFSRAVPNLILQEPRQLYRRAAG